MCCDGHKVSCAKNTSGDADADRILDQCTLQHEDTHHDDVNCGANDGKRTPTRPGFADTNMDNMRYQECVGYCAGLRCLRCGLVKCKPPACTQAVENKMKWSKVRIQSLCHGYVPPEGC